MESKSNEFRLTRYITIRPLSNQPPKPKAFQVEGREESSECEILINYAMDFDVNYFVSTRSQRRREKYELEPVPHIPKLPPADGTRSTPNQIAINQSGHSVLVKPNGSRSGGKPDHKCMSFALLIQVIRKSLTMSPFDIIPIRMSN